ncbi:hypothetical protein SSP35_01_00970 [Streptomyces sp. NBRC 110611]|nr:hypothetical protein SSP35_01_00970 [Streptomyces sp. NBRC 110611]
MTVTGRCVSPDGARYTAQSVTFHRPTPHTARQAATGGGSGSQFAADLRPAEARIPPGVAPAMGHHGTRRRLRRAGPRDGHGVRGMMGMASRFVRLPAATTWPTARR